MNSTISDSVGDPTYNGIHGLSFLFGLCIGAVVLISSIGIASYFCSRVFSPSRPQERSSQPRSHDDTHSISIDLGLDDSTLHGYPKFLFSQAELHKKYTSITTTITCCSICLAEYNSSDMLRLLPDCGHLFHLNCVDPWLRKHPTCPMCRSSPIPTPLLTLQLEVAPMANHT